MAGNILYMGNEKYRLRVSNGFDSNGKRKYFNKTVTCSSKREAEKELAKFITSIEGGCTYSAKKVTVNDFSKQWLETYVKLNLSPTTYQSYNEKLNKHISYLFEICYRFTLLNFMYNTNRFMKKFTD